jgi:hypothetical protein
MGISNWAELCKLLGKQFDLEVDLNGVLYLVGVRERGLTLQPFTKEEKLSLINLGSCTLYLEMGLLEKTGTDAEGWPVFSQKALAPSIPEERKHKILQDCAIRYFSKIYP